MLSLASGSVRGLNLQSDLYLQAMPRAMAPELVDQASAELGARVDAVMPSVTAYAQNPLATNARFQYNMVAGLTETSLRAVQGDGAATSDLTSLVTQAALPEFALARLGNAGRVVQQGRGVIVEEAGGISPHVAPRIIGGEGRSVVMDGHKIYDPAYPALSSNPRAQYRFSDPEFRSTGGDIYFGENLSVSYHEVRQRVAAKALYVGEVRLDNVLDLTDLGVLQRMGIDRARLTARVDSPEQQRAVYSYANEVSNQAFEVGYNGILYPRSRARGNAMVIFGGRPQDGTISPVIDMRLP